MFSLPGSLFSSGEFGHLAFVRKFKESFVRHSSFKAVAVEEVTDLQIRTKSVTVEEKTLIVQSGMARV
ncbi:hypothetical protein B7P43_G14885 [Cryptotermes secundus]|uniref:Uncharacterized protein n=1 Tax=Cryptotermes secundus TaxID=105785 RepID=A0A2J7RQZ1_9NEOP|nr:hypothetical protein B7P43_G14885 [Cryptotermes secundus]